MKQTLLLVGALLILIFAGSGFSKHPHQEDQPSSKLNSNTDIPQIAILGVFHFGGTSDLAAVKMDNPLGERRQKEIKALIEQIEKFQPTKILLEYPYAKSEKLNKRYHSFLADTYELTENEIDQIGLRLAKKLGHDQLFAIDQKLDLPDGELFAYCQKTERIKELETMIGYVQNYTRQESERLAQMELPAYLATMNTDEVDRITNELYLKDMLSFGDPDNEVGANFSATWYKRNMMILNNIDRVTDQQDRVLVIIGSAHRAVIKDFISDRSDLQYVEIGQYLK